MFAVSSKLKPDSAACLPTKFNAVNISPTSIRDALAALARDWAESALASAPRENDVNVETITSVIVLTSSPVAEANIREADSKSVASFPE